MRHLLIVAIRLYWRVVPARSRRRCLFAKSCSRHVFDQAVQAGGIAALKALADRYRACRPGYAPLAVTDWDGAPLLRLADGRVVRADQLSHSIVAECFPA